MFHNNIFINRPRVEKHTPMFTNRNIPEPMKREIRQRCGFGCVICGSIIYDYDHMLKDWSEVKEHISQDITLLCPGHHREKTNGLLTRQQVEAANKNPYNFKNHFSSPYMLHFTGGVGVAVIANNIFTNDSLVKAFEGQNLPYVVPILIDGNPIIGFKFQDERLLLDIKIFNEFNEPILVVLDNQLVFKPEAWDVDLRGSTLVIREAPRKIVLKLEFCPPNKIIVSKAKIRFNGVHLELKKDHFILNRHKSAIFTHNAFSGLVGISIGNTGNFPRGIIHEQKVKRSS